MHGIDPTTVELRPESRSRKHRAIRFDTRTDEVEIIGVVIGRMLAATAPTPPTVVNDSPASPHWRRTSARHGRAQRERAPALIDLEVAQEAHAEQHLVANELLAHATAHASALERTERDPVEPHEPPGHDRGRSDDLDALVPVEAESIGKRGRDRNAARAGVEQELDAHTVDGAGRGVLPGAILTQHELGAPVRGDTCDRRIDLIGKTPRPSLDGKRRETEKRDEPEDQHHDADPAGDIGRMLLAAHLRIDLYKCTFVLSGGEGTRRPPDGGAE